MSKLYHLGKCVGCSRGYDKRESAKLAAVSTTARELLAVVDACPRCVVRAVSEVDKGKAAAQ